MVDVLFETPRANGEGIATMVGSRVYGGTAATVFVDRLNELVKMDLPEPMLALSARISGESRLLALTAGATGAQISEGYGHDLQMLGRYRTAFTEVIVAAMKARASADATDAQALIDDLTALITPIEFKPTLKMGPVELALGFDELLARLQGNVKTDIESLQRNVALWLHALAEGDHISVVERFGDHAVRYHYFRMDSSRTVLDRQERDPGMTLHGRNVTTTTTQRVEVTGERRTHTLVDAHTHELAGYRDKVPERVAQLIEALPVEVRPFVTIIDGNVTQEDVVRNLISGQTETTVESVFKPDPALVLFDTYAIAGWGDPVSEPAGSVYQGHALKTADKALLWSIGAIVFAIGLPIVFGQPRIAIVVGIIAVVITLFSQAGMRMRKN